MSRRLVPPPLRIAAGAAGWAGAARTADGRWPDARGRPFAVCRRRGSRYELDIPGLGRFRFSDRGAAVTAAGAPGRPRAALAAGYRRHAVPFVLAALGTEVLHASAVEAADAVVAFCGTSGAGKSSLAMGLSRRGYPLWADDAVALDISARAVSALPLPFRPRLRPPAAAFFGVAPGDGRPSPERVGTPRPARLGAVCVLRPRGPAARARRLRRLRAAEALVALLPHAYCWTFAEPARNRRMIARYLALVARVPVFEAQRPRGWRALPSFLDEIERGVIEGARRSRVSG